MKIDKIAHPKVKFLKITPKDCYEPLPLAILIFKGPPHLMMQQKNTQGNLLFKYPTSTYQKKCKIQENHIVSATKELLDYQFGIYRANVSRESCPK
eukprot:c18789_g1_i1 orf=137-424(-)